MVFYPYTLRKLRRSDLVVATNHRFNKPCRGGLSYPGFYIILYSPFIIFFRSLFPLSTVSFSPSPVPAAEKGCRSYRGYSSQTAKNPDLQLMTWFSIAPGFSPALRPQIGFSPNLPRTHVTYNIISIPFNLFGIKNYVN